jgi:hypothetical protein
MAKRQLVQVDSTLADRVEAELAEELAAFEPAIPPSQIRDARNKWLASSAWQKSIRRGETATARRMVTGLYRLDPDYPWRRLPVIALEDIGAANPALVAKVMWVAGKAVWRREHGGDLKVLLWLTEQLAGSLKDRVACDLEVWTDVDPELKLLRAEISSMSRPALVETILADPALERRHLALRYLAGTRAFPGLNLVKDRNGSFQDVVEVARALDLTEDAIAISLWARNRGGSMALSLLLAMRMRGLATEVATVADPIVALPMIGAYPSHAFDLHCQQGKRAIAYFGKACQPMRQWLLARDVPESRITDTLMELLFRAETEMLDQRLVYGESRRVQLMSWYATVCHWSPLAIDHVEEGVMMMREHLPDLHLARERIMKAG